MNKKNKKLDRISEVETLLRRAFSPKAREEILKWYDPK